MARSDHVTLDLTILELHALGAAINYVVDDTPEAPAEHGIGDREVEALVRVLRKMPVRVGRRPAPDPPLPMSTLHDPADRYYSTERPQ